MELVIEPSELPEGSIGSNDWTPSSKTLFTRQLSLASSKHKVSTKLDRFHIRQQYKKKSRTRNSSDLAHVTQLNLRSPDLGGHQYKPNHIEVESSFRRSQTPGLVISITNIMAGTPRNKPNKIRNEIDRDNNDVDGVGSSASLLWGGRLVGEVDVAARSCYKQIKQDSE